MSPSWRRRLGLALGLALAGCAAGSAPPGDHFWRLGAELAAAPALPAPALDGTLVVERFRADGLLGERALLWSEADDPYELRAHAYHHWAEPPGDMLQQRLVAYLRARGAARRIVTPEMRQRADYTLAGRVLRFERVVGASAPRVVVELRLTLQRTLDGALLANEVYHQEAEAAGPEVRDALPAFEAAVEAVFARFVDDLASPALAHGAGAEGRL